MLLVPCGVGLWRLLREVGFPPAESAMPTRPSRLPFRGSAKNPTVVLVVKEPARLLLSWLVLAQQPERRGLEPRPPPSSRRWLLEALRAQPEQMIAAVQQGQPGGRQTAKGRLSLPPFSESRVEKTTPATHHCEQRRRWKYERAKPTELLPGA
jgi:hypothetical protein